MNNNEIEVRFSDLLAMLLKSSRIILCLVLILGFLGGVYGAYSVVKAQPKVTQEDVEAATVDLAIAETNMAKAQSSLAYRNEVLIPGAVQKVDRSERMIRQLQEYMKSSIYYNMDPYHRGVAWLRFAVEVEDAAVQNSSSDDLCAKIVTVYTQMCPFSTEIVEQIRAIMGVETQSQYIEELVSVASDDDHRIVEVCFFYDNLPTAEQVVDYLYQTMTANAAGKTPAHRTSIMASYSGYETDWDMSKSHAINETSLIKMEEALLVANESLQSFQNTAEEEPAVRDASETLNSARKALQNAKYNYERSRPSLRSMAKRAIKYGVYGGLIGIVLGCCYAWCKGLFSGIVQNQNEVIHRYSFPLIGVLPRSKKVWFDKTIQKLEGDPTGDFEAVAHATVQSLISRISDQSVCLISSCCKSTAERLAASTGNKVQVIGNIIDNADAVKELANYEGIVLVEERGKSRIDLVDAEVLRAKALSKEILGIVLA